MTTEKELGEALKRGDSTIEVTFRLYLCSSDYAVQVVRVLKKENENG